MAGETHAKERKYEEKLLQQWPAAILWLFSGSKRNESAKRSSESWLAYWRRRRLYTENDRYRRNEMTMAAKAKRRETPPYRHLSLQPLVRIAEAASGGLGYSAK